MKHSLNGGLFIHTSPVMASLQPNPFARPSYSQKLFPRGLNSANPYHENKEVGESASMIRAHLQEYVEMRDGQVEHVASTAPINVMRTRKLASTHR